MLRRLNQISSSWPAGSAHVVELNQQILMKLNFSLGASVCIGFALACAAWGASYSYQFPYGDGDGTTSPGTYGGTGLGDWSDTILTDSPSGSGYNFNFPSTVTEISLSAWFSGSTTITAGTVAGTFHSVYAHIQFRLENINTGTYYYWDYGPSANPNAVETTSVSLAASATSASLPLAWASSHVFDVAPQAGVMNVYRLTWNMSTPTVIGDGGKSGTAGNTDYQVGGVLVPEPGEYAMIAVFGLAAFAGWRRVRG